MYHTELHTYLNSKILKLLSSRFRLFDMVWRDAWSCLLLAMIFFIMHFTMGPETILGIKKINFIIKYEKRLTYWCLIHVCIMSFWQVIKFWNWHWMSKYLQRVPSLRKFWDLEKTVLHETCVSGTVLQSPTTAKIPHLHVHKPKTVLVETVLVIFV